MENPVDPDPLPQAGEGEVRVWAMENPVGPDPLPAAGEGEVLPLPRH